MPFRRQVYTNKYSSLDWDIMAKAYELAIQHIGKNPSLQRDRLARGIMTFFDSGVHCASTLSSLAMSREMSLIDIARTRNVPACCDDDIALEDGIYFMEATGKWKDSTTS
ncbi:hypothetical protein QFZ34_000538 [Phyllobacterium ifriqiyense]|uniref:Uncharacterized protein n=1 Tax=Phyllobacterium ifriqiyense TaxID=314238 RepID=A0ABU0S4D5_9HYPH|nr:hypothetical protein [Phyllobacterium ifriqiyense]MDQ0995361.1 hypothetical protein [Phyllobacterium ifriqiyense]